MTIKLEVGKFYQTRDKRIVHITHYHDMSSLIYPFMGSFVDGDEDDVKEWAANGVYDNYNQSPHDIVCELSHADAINKALAHAISTTLKQFPDSKPFKRQGKDEIVKQFADDVIEFLTYYKLRNNSIYCEEFTDRVEHLFITAQILGGKK